RKLLLTVTGALILSPGAVGAKHDPNHIDPFVTGDAAETRLVREIRHELVTLPYYGVFDDLAFRVDGGKITLLGDVTRPTLKSDAERVVKRIEGVTQVDN